VKYDRRCQKSAHAQIDKRMTLCFSFIRYKCCDPCLFLYMLTNDIEKLDRQGILNKLAHLLLSFLFLIENSAFKIIGCTVQYMHGHGVNTY
jgi:hypothetical protein